MSNKKENKFCCRESRKVKILDIYKYTMGLETISIIKEILIQVDIKRGEDVTTNHIGYS